MTKINFEWIAAKWKEYRKIEGYQWLVLSHLCFDVKVLRTFQGQASDFQACEAP